jgi:hypothetical protein
MAKRKQIGESEALQPGWAEPREPLEEKRVPSLTNAGAVYGATARAAARSGPKFAPGVGIRETS